MVAQTGPRFSPTRKWCQDCGSLPGCHLTEVYGATFFNGTPLEMGPIRKFEFRETEFRETEKPIPGKRPRTDSPETVEPWSGNSRRRRRALRGDCGGPLVRVPAGESRRGTTHAAGTESQTDAKGARLGDWDS